jgi:hypothetical protein
MLGNPLITTYLKTRSVVTILVRSGSCSFRQLASNPIIVGYSWVFLNGALHAGQMGVASPGFSQTCGT